ncbi:putative transporter [Zancudomyces culisetae]|uniref:Putative transporter n=1 Tax=Zancudomyces culisetae TaxID=1213189 RepID=A0A1R1PQG2_ZANCU|nr:putative transporter [Zancudomyces culisetae]|eukprot:OMH83198.1 putative transporter [Zancudomyces culisetae]
MDNLGKKERGSQSSLRDQKDKYDVNKVIALTTEEESIIKKARRKIDIRILPIMYLLYLSGAMDRSNVGAAMVNGLVESGFTPGMITYLGYWYTREELGPRMSVMFSALPASGIVNLLYGAFVLIRVGNLAPYQPIFIFGGMITFIVAIASIFVIKDYPERAKFLTSTEQSLVIKRINASQGSAEKSRITIRTILGTILDWKVWVFALLNLSRSYILYVMGFVGPSIIKSFGFSSATSTFLSSLVSITGTVSAIAFAFLFQSTPYFIRVLTLDILSVGCFAVVAYTRNKVLRLVFISILGIPLYAAIPTAMSWMSVNAGSTQKRALKSALFVMIGSVAGIISPYLFTTATAPEYTSGYAFAFGLYGVSVVLTLLLAFSLNRMNKNKDMNPQDVSHLSPEEQRAMHDYHPNFRYML